VSCNKAFNRNLKMAFSGSWACHLDIDHSTCKSKSLKCNVISKSIGFVTRCLLIFLHSCIVKTLENGNLALFFFRYVYPSEPRLILSSRIACDKLHGETCAVVESTPRIVLYGAQKREKKWTS